MVFEYYSRHLDLFKKETVPKISQCLPEKTSTLLTENLSMDISQQNISEQVLLRTIVIKYSYK